MTVNPSPSGATQIICSWRCSKHTGHRGAKGRCASNYRHFDPLLMQPAQLAALTAGVAAGDLTPGEAAELSRLVEAYVKALEAQDATGPCVVTISPRDEGL